MSQYQRLFIKGGLYFFTVVTYNRKHILCEEQSINRIKDSFRYTISKRPFTIEGLVILPDHLHCIWQLPDNDDNFSLRWNMLKRYFSIGFTAISNSRREKNIWQRRYWERLIRNENDLNLCLDYIHYNPVKHGYVLNPSDWPYSSFHKYVQLGRYDKNWGQGEEPNKIKNFAHGFE